MMNNMVDIAIGSAGYATVDNSHYHIIKSLLNKGKYSYIPAIKRYRELTGNGLREAKYYVDAIKNNLIKPTIIEWIPEELWIID